VSTWREYLPSLNQEMFLRLDPFGSSRFHVPICFVLGEAPDITRLQDAFGRCIEKHELLRTTFAAIPAGCGPLPDTCATPGTRRLGHSLMESRYRQRVHDGASASVEQYHLTHSGHEWTSRVRDAASEHFERRFDPERPPALRLLLITRPGERPLMQMVAHHLVVDGWSVRRFIKDLNDAYNGDSLDDGNGESLTFGEFSQQERRQIHEGRWDRSIQYWRQQWSEHGDSMVGPEALDAWSWHQTPSAEGGHETSRLGAEFSLRLSAFCRRHRVTPYIALLTALFARLHRESGANQLAVLTSFANRDATTERIVGPLSNTNLLGIHCAPDMRLECLLHEVRATVLSAIAHQMLPTPVSADISTAASPDRLQRPPTYMPLVCDALNLGLVRARPGDLVCDYIRPLVPPPHQLWRIRLETTREGPVLSMFWPGGRLEYQRVCDAMTDLEHACEALVSNSDARLCDLPKRGRRNYAQASASKHPVAQPLTE
jgi:hypothetical protein